MFHKLPFEDFQQLSYDYKRVAVFQEISGDQLTPVSAYLALEAAGEDITLFESSPKEKRLGRYSHLCFNPELQISIFGQHIYIENNNEKQHIQAQPLDYLRAIQKKLHVKTSHNLSGYCGGLVGFMSYNVVHIFENIPDQHKNINNLPDMFFRFCNSNITFDHQTGKIILSTVVNINESPLETQYKAAYQYIEYIIEKLMVYQDVKHFHHTQHKPLESDTIKTDINDLQFCNLVKKAKEHIIEGDIFQIVLSRSFQTKILSKPFDIYRALRYTSPSPYMFYMNHKDFSIACVSPEKLVSVRQGVIETCPLAGTRPRGKTPEEDKQFAEDLLHDSKEVAEHMMLVDLARNDIGALSKAGTVQVKKLKHIEKYSRVMHISSTVEGVLDTQKDVFDVLRYCLPAGTLSGAPKIRAMELIDKLEASKRDLYGGAICAIDANNNLDSCIAIRMVTISNKVATVRAGAGIVYDSCPQKEADETRHKARSILEGIALAEGTVA